MLQWFFEDNSETLGSINEEICGCAEYFSFIMVLYHRDSFSYIAVDYRNT